jgi:hypothetical protein
LACCYNNQVKHETHWLVNYIHRNLCVCQVLEWNSWETVSGNKTPREARFVLQSQPLFSVFSFCLYASVTLASIVADLELDSSWPTGGSSGWGIKPRSCQRAVPSRAVTWVGPACLIPVNNPGNNHVSGRERGNTWGRQGVIRERFHTWLHKVKSTDITHIYAHPWRAF